MFKSQELAQQPYLSFLSADAAEPADTGDATDAGEAADTGEVSTEGRRRRTVLRYMRGDSG